MVHFPRKAMLDIEKRVAFLEDYGVPYDPYDFDEEEYLANCLDEDRDLEEPKTLESGRYPARLMSVNNNDDTIL